MITAYIEEYHNDYYKKEHIENFTSLSSLAERIFESMRTDYSDKETGWSYMYFPVENEAAGLNCDGPSKIEFIPEVGGPSFWIHQIKEDGRIIFSDGRMTAGQKHWSQTVREWCKNCRARQKAPKFDFAD